MTVAKTEEDQVNDITRTKFVEEFPRLLAKWREEDQTLVALTAAPQRLVTTIVVINVRPPLTARSHDWEAYYAEDELLEDMPRGYGRTAAAAVAHLVKRKPREGNAEESA